MQHKEDYINIGLMLFSCVIAFVLPFELFLFSYAVLGPLHYLTEIGWLHQRNYFSTGKKDYTILIVLCLLISLGVVFHDIFIVRAKFAGLFSPDTLTTVMKMYARWFPVFIFSALIGSIGLVVFKNTRAKLGLFILGLVVGYMLRDTSFTKLAVGIFVPTLIHVYVFTALFMFYGALKAKSIPGVSAVFVLLLCALSFYFIQYVPEGFQVSEYVKNSILKSGFGSVNATAIGLFKSGSINQFDIFESKRGLMIQRFIAFAYTYHYLNWFSKTEIIKWHKVSKSWLISTIIIWITSIALYYNDYRTGLIALFFLSLLHVFLEFPLNIKSVIGILEESKRVVFAKKS